MVCELRTLERRRGPQGKDVIDHERLAGAHDDYLNALALAAVTAVAGRGTEPAILWGAEFGDYASARQRALGEVEG